MTLKVVFMGSPDFALPVLRALADNYSVVGVITQPDKPAGRGKTLTSPPVKNLADELIIPVIQPRRLREPEAQEQLRLWAPDLIVVAAFGQILRQDVLDLPRLGCVNVHASLLPRWRGAAPIQACILMGDEYSGVSIMKMDAGIDTGAVISQKQILLATNETSGSLSEKLANLGADLLIETLPRYLRGEISPVEQNSEESTYARMLNKEDGELKFDHAVDQLERMVRAFQPWPGAYVFIHGEMLKVHQAVVERDCDLKPGERGSVKGFPTVGANGGALVLEVVQPAGKKAMSGDVYLRGARAWTLQDGDI